MERIPDDAQCERQKQIYIKKLETIQMANAIPNLYKNMLGRYSMALLGTNFRPLWTNIKPIVIGASRQDGFWHLVQEYLTTIQLASHDGDGDDDEISTLQPKYSNNKRIEKNPFICTSLEVQKSWWIAVNEFCTDKEQYITAVYHRMSSPLPPNVDYSNCYCLLIKALGSIPQKVTKHSKYLMGLFLGIVENDAEETKNARLRLLAFLECFSSVSSPSKLYDFEKFEAAVLHLLANGDSRLQEGALNCVLKFGYPGMEDFGQAFKNLAEDENIRDSLATLSMEDIRDRITTEARPKVIDVLVRILWGKLSSRKGRNSRAILRPRRIAIFSFIATMTAEEREPMIQLILAPFMHLKVQTTGNEIELLDPLEFENNGAIAKQIGFLNVLGDFLQQLRTLVLDYIPRFLEVILHLLHGAERFIAENELDCGFKQDQARQVKQLATKRLTQLFEIDTDFCFDQYVPLMYQTFIGNRIEKLAIENTQNASAILDMLSVWSKNSKYVDYLGYNSKVVGELLDILTAKKVQEQVIVFVIALFENIIETHITHPELEILPRLIANDIGKMLEKFKVLLETFSINASGKSINPLSDRIIVILAKISVFVTQSELAERLVDILLPFLRTTAKSAEKRKVEILEILKHFLPLLDSVKNVEPTETPYYNTLSQLFFTLESRESRTVLCDVFVQLCQFGGKEFENLVQLLTNMNCWSTKRLDELDFDKLFDSFSELNQNLFNSLSVSYWQPILYNLFYHVRNKDEFAVRSATSQAILKFVERVKSSQGEIEYDHFRDSLTHLVFPQIKLGIQKTTLPVRDEFVGLLGKIVSIHTDIPQFADMECLLGDRNDDETNFFSNAVHVQVHRRMRSMKMLSGLVREDKISNVNISTIFVPLMTHYIFESDRATDHQLINESISCLASCSSVLGWSRYLSMVKRYLNAFRFRPELSKVLIRLLVSILEEFHFELSGADMLQEATNIELKELQSDEEEDQGQIESLVNNQRIQKVVTEKLLPSFQKIITVENDEDLPARIPLAIAIVKLIIKLPNEIIPLHLPRILLTLTSFLTSHLQSSRDSTRNALVSISLLLGSKHLNFIIQSLTTSLKRGYHLHILSYTLHAILEANIELYKVGSIDGCVESIVKICLGDIFGETGKEKEVQELKSKMREIRASKSYDTLELLCRLITIGFLTKILLPIKKQLLDSSNAKLVQKMQEIFRKLSMGLNMNPSIDLDQFMVFIHQLLTETLPLTQLDGNTSKKLSDSEKHFKVHMKRKELAAETLKHYESNAYLFVDFGLSLLHTSIKREKLTSKETHHLELLDPLVSLLGKSLYSKHASTITNALRIFNIIVKWPLPDMEDTKPVLLTRMFQLISKSASSDSEMIQNVFRLLTVVLRDCKDVPVPERKLITLISLLKIDLEEPGKQSTTFSLIRGILDRNIVSSEIYDLMDIVSKLLVTSQTDQIRQHCRHIYLQFLTSYPHGHARLRQQIVNLFSNLDYEFESGRTSVLELLQLAITKFSDDLFLEYSNMMFLTVSMVIANDDSSKCKEMAAILLKSLFTRIGMMGMEKIVLIIDKWLAQEDNIEMQKLGIQIIGIVVDTFKNDSIPWATKWLSNILSGLKLCLDEWNSASDVDQELLQWELGYFSLKTLSKYIRHVPDLIFQQSDVIKILDELLLHPHQWIRLVCCKIFGSIFSYVPLDSESEEVGNSSLELVMTLVDSEQTLCHLARKFCLQLDSNLLTQDLAVQIVKNLLFLTKRFGVLFNNNVENTVINEDENALQIKFEPGNGVLWLVRKLVHLAKTDRQKSRGTLLVNSF